MKKRIIGALCALILILAVILSSCAGTEPRSTSFQSMDTLMSVKVYGGDSDLCDRLQTRIDSLDAQLDATDENSDVYQLNQNGKADVSGDTAEIITTFYNEFKRSTLLGKTTINVKIKDGKPIIASLSAE